MKQIRIIAACGYFAVILIGNVFAAENSLKTLWQIGRSDNSTEGLSLAPDGYSRFGQPGMFIVGKSNFAVDWPYVHPGPLDDWAGLTCYTFHIAFGLRETLSEGNAALVITFADTHSENPPLMEARINGRDFMKQLPRGGSSTSINGDLKNARPSQWTITFPAALLGAGDNEITLTTLSGNWVLYDTIELRTPKQAILQHVSKKSMQTLAKLRKTDSVKININCSDVINTMRGGIGASWHAIEEEIPDGKKHRLNETMEVSYGGSGWGAYPRAENERAWKQIYDHAAWLGFDWNRVEVEQRIYEPERDIFTFDSYEMKILYRILDWNEKHGSDVFFQQMWHNVDWLTYPKFRGDPVTQVHSAPYDMPAFAEGLATLMDHLINNRGYTCIKWLNIVNEPGANHSWWQAPPNKPLPITDGIIEVRKALGKRGLDLPLSGPGESDHMDRTHGFPEHYQHKYSYEEHLQAYDFHTAHLDYDFRTHGSIAKQVRYAADWVRYAHRQSKAVFLSEFGTVDYSSKPDESGPNCLEAVLTGCETILRESNVGVDAFNRPSFINRGDLDGQWQFIDTWDREKKELLEDFQPHPNSYFGIGLMTRFIAKNSSVLKSEVIGGRIAPWQRVFCAAYRSPKGQYTIAVVNDSQKDYPMNMTLSGLVAQKQFYRYRYGNPQRDRIDIRVNPENEYLLGPINSAIKERLPAQSLTLYSTFMLKHGDPGIIVEQ